MLFLQELSCDSKISVLALSRALFSKCHGTNEALDNELVASTLDKLIVPSERESFQLIVSMLKSIKSHISNDPDPNTFPLLCNLILLNILHMQEAQAQIELAASTSLKSPQIDNFVLSDGARYCLFAKAAYGFSLEKLKSGYDAPTLKNVLHLDFDGWSILSNTGINENDLVAVKLDDSYGEFPTAGHFIAVDHSTKSVVLSIRGTHALKDQLTNFSAESVSFFDGEAHRGFIGSMYKLIEESIDIIKEQLEMHSAYRLVLTGHSLGASIALLLSIALSNERKALGIVAPITCFAYAAAPCFSSPSILSEELSKNLHTFVHGYDLVTRASLNNGVNVIEKIREIDDLPSNLEERVSFIISKVNPSPNLETLSLKNSIKETLFCEPLRHVFKDDGSLAAYVNSEVERTSSGYSNDPEHCVGYSPTSHVHKVLSIPGQTYWINKKPSTEEFFIQRVNHRQLEKIYFVATAIDDHDLGQYEASLNSLLSLQRI